MYVRSRKTSVKGRYSLTQVGASTAANWRTELLMTSWVITTPFASRVAFEFRVKPEDVFIENESALPFSTS